MRHPPALHPVLALEALVTIVIICPTDCKFPVGRALPSCAYHPLSRCLHPGASKPPGPTHLPQAGESQVEGSDGQHDLPELMTWPAW